MALTLDALMAIHNFPEVSAFHDLMVEFAFDSASYGARVDTLPKIFLPPDGSTTLWKSGMFTHHGLLQLMVQHPACKSGVKDAVVRRLLRNCIEYSVVQEYGPNMFVSHGWNRDLVMQMHSFGILRNVLINRPEYVVEAYRDAVLEINVEKEEAPYAGTGFVCAYISGGIEKDYIITAKHNVDPNDKIVLTGISTANGAAIPHELLKWSHHPDMDLSVCEIGGAFCTKFRLSPFSMILTETITLGFPNVPTAEQRYMLAHRGEVNAKVNSYLRKGAYLLISNAISPGNSGSPVIDRSGLVLGMATEAFEGQFAEFTCAMQAALDGTEITRYLDHLSGAPSAP